MTEKLIFRTHLEKKPFPCIIHWNQNHFVVLYDIKKYRKHQIIHVADPGKGLLKYILEDFLDHWISTKSGGEEKGIAIEKLLKYRTLDYHHFL